mmetsp:Transcript_8407/g.28073  ORF Transcript_8407/g.28073 Transcript_8407/m.28073 type:complete len:232 (+) Transcript_8407:2612-3307(+)
MLGNPSGVSGTSNCCPRSSSGIWYKPPGVSPPLEGVAMSFRAGVRIGTYVSGCGKTLYPSWGNMASKSSSESCRLRSSTSRSHRSALYCSGVMGAAPEWAAAAAKAYASGVMAPASCPGPGVSPPTIKGVSLSNDPKCVGVASTATFCGVSSHRLRPARRPAVTPPDATSAGVASQRFRRRAAGASTGAVGFWSSHSPSVLFRLPSLLSSVGLASSIRLAASSHTSLSLLP